MPTLLTEAYKTDPLYARLHFLPKVDLHTHLNGSISSACMDHLASLLFGNESSTAQLFQFTLDQQGIEQAQVPFSLLIDNTVIREDKGKSHSEIDYVAPLADPTSRMQHCFKVFDAIYKVMNNIDFTRVAIQDILFHYLSENTVYMEMRTSLRNGMYSTFEAHQRATQDNSRDGQNTEHAATQRDYWKAVTNTIAVCLTLHAWSGPHGDNLLVSDAKDATSIPFFLPGVVSPSPPFAVIRPSAGVLLPASEVGEKVVSPYLAALDAWITIYEGSSTEVRSFVLGLRKEALKVINILASFENFHSIGSLAEVPPPSSGCLHLFPSVISAIARLRVRMLISLSRSHSMKENESTGELIPEILSADAEYLSNHVSLMLSQSKKYKIMEPLEGQDRTGVRDSFDEPTFSCVFPLLVGIDLGGSAYKGDLRELLSALETFRSSYGLPLTLHGGEKKNDDEVEAMLSLNPDRWGHLVFISERHRQQLQTRANGITALELCLTSNMVTNGSDDVSEHHIHQWLECVPCAVPQQEYTKGNSENEIMVHQELGCPLYYRISFKGNSHVSLHTDDRGVFDTCMTRELWLFSCNTSVFPIKDFEEICSQKRADTLFPVIKEFHRQATEIVFVPPYRTSCTSHETSEKNYRLALLRHFDAACEK